MSSTARRACARLAPVALLLGAVLIGGCFDEPEIEDRWTRLDITSSNLTANQALSPGASESISVSLDITYRKIVTGFCVAELRASTITSGSVALNPNAPRLRMAQDIDRILANSVTRGRAVRPVTGWDHLIQHLDLGFQGAVPAAGDPSAAGLFLLCYLGSGEEVEIQGGMDSVIVTPFGSEAFEILPIGMELQVASSRSH
jgi:hypothetical protein